MKRKVLLNDKLVEFDFEAGDRVIDKRGDTGTVIGIERGFIINVDWDGEAKKRKSVAWLPISLQKLEQSGGTGE